MNNIIIDLPFPSFISAMFRYPYFHLPHAVLFIFLMMPFRSYLILAIRVILLGSSVSVVIWAENCQYWLDIILWNFFFSAINLIHIIVLIYQLKPLKYNNELEQLYIKLFYPLKVSGEQFKEVLSCILEIRFLERFEIFHEHSSNPSESLTMVLSGKLLISKGCGNVHFIYPYQFLDSKELLDESADQFDKVTAMAIVDSMVLLWDTNKLRYTIIYDTFLYSVFNQIFGEDIVKKFIEDREIRHNYLTPKRFRESEYEMIIDMNDKKKALLHLKEDIEAILKQELQVDNLSLSTIVEVDFKTASIASV